MTHDKRRRSGLSQGQIEETFKALRLDDSSSIDPETLGRAINNFGILRDVPVTADTVTRPLREDPGNA